VEPSDPLRTTRTSRSSRGTVRICFRRPATAALEDVFRGLPGGRCVHHVGGRDGLSDKQRGRPLEFGNRMGRWRRRISPDKYAIPSWQTAAAAGCAKCSKTYRNGPDVRPTRILLFTSVADQTTCTANSYGGTSFAAPMWAGYLALANQQAVAAGGSPLGFINPTLYTIGLGSGYDTAFHDITSGSNGYSATIGYDLASGWAARTGAV